MRHVLLLAGQRQGARQGQPHRRHLRGEPQLRQPVRRLGGRQRPRPTPTQAHTTQVNEAGNAYTCLKQNDVNLPGRVALPADVHRHDGREPGRPVHQRLHERPVHRSTTTSRRRRRRVRRPRRVQPAERLLDPNRPAGWLHPRPRPPLLSRAVPARWRGPGPLRHRQRRDGPDDGLLRHEGPADLHSTSTPRATPNYAIEDDFFQARIRRLVPQSPVADRRGLAGRSGRRHRRRQRGAPPGPRRTTGCRRTSRSTHPRITPTGPPPSIPPTAS